MRAALDELQDVLLGAIADIRRAIFALRPVELDALGFFPALRQLVADFGGHNQLAARLDVSGPQNSLLAAYELPLRGCSRLFLRVLRFLFPNALPQGCRKHRISGREIVREKGGDRMIRVYFDYQTAKQEGVRIHPGPSCNGFHRMDTSPARKVRLTEESLQKRIRPFTRQEHRFGSAKEISSLWIEIDLGEEAAEREVAARIKELLGKRYKPFATAELRDCDCPRR